MENKIEQTIIINKTLEKMDYTKFSLSQLKDTMKERNIKGISGKNKKQLIEILEQSDSKIKEIHPTETKPKSEISEYLNIENMINTITLGECIEFMKKIPENSIDMICTDPPYFLDGLGNDWNKDNIDNKGASALVGNLPKGMKFDRNQSKKFYEFYLKVSAECFRILKPGGAFISFSSPRLYHSMAMAIEESGFEIRDMLGWIYTQSQVKAFSQNHIIDKDKKLNDNEKEELKLLCNNWKTPQLKPAIEPMCLAVKPIEGRYIDNFKIYGTGLMNTSEETKTGESYFPSNIITTDTIEETMDKVFLVSKPTRTEKCEYNTHLSVKPVNLISHLIKLFTKPNSIILDPFMGSGTTAIACIESKRNYIGFDINKEYIDISERRVSDFISQASA